ncbi:hypothetical protein AB1Y20_003611 [Prymnesium parvum]|uniref:Auxin efflux carrier component n=1 Tax=Prymnesium parvum TaxID=97485 RepID=A0AB34J5A9_PRYPA
MPFDADALQLAVASLKSVLEALTLAAAGLYLGHSGVMTQSGAKLLSALSVKVTIPCLLFSRVLASVDYSVVVSVWPMLLLPVVLAALGSMVGWVVALLCKPPDEFRRGAVAAVACANSTGMPLILLSVLHTQLEYLFDEQPLIIIALLPAAPPSAPMMAPKPTTDPVVYLGVYLLTFPVVQWLLGSCLLSPHDSHGSPELPPVRAEGRGADEATAANSQEGKRVDPWQNFLEPPGGTASHTIMPQLPLSSPTHSVLPACHHLEGMADGEAEASHSLARRPTSRSLAIGLHSLNSSISPQEWLSLPLTSSEATPRPLSHSKASWYVRTQRVLREQLLVPPVVGVLLGLLCSSLPPAYYLLCGGSMGERLPAEVACPTSRAPLGFLARGVATLGDAAVPINLILLGNALSTGPDWSALPLRASVGIALAKMLVMPLLALGLMLALDRALSDDGLGLVNLGFDETFYLALVAIAASPTANTMLMVTELFWGNRSAMGTAIFFQYMCAPFVLTCTFTLVVLIIKQLL